MKSIYGYSAFVQSESKDRWLRRGCRPHGRKKQIEFEWEEFARRLPAETLINQAFDARYGTDTAEEIRLEDTGVSALRTPPHQTNIGPYGSRIFTPRGDAKIAFEGFTFIDIGSVKGKMLMMAGRVSIHARSGIEYSPGLRCYCPAQFGNIPLTQSALPRPQAILGNALEWDLPKGPVIASYLMLWIPRQRERSSGMLKAIFFALEPAYLVYCNSGMLRKSATDWTEYSN